MCMMNVNCTLEVSIQEFTDSVCSNVVSLATTQIHCVVVDNVLCKLLTPPSGNACHIVSCKCRALFTYSGVCTLRLVINHNYDRLHDNTQL